MMRMRIVRAELRAFVLPLVAPLATAHGPIAERAGWLVTLEDEDGRIGQGEATPLPDFGGEDLAACRAALRAALPTLVDGAARTLDEALEQIEPSFAARPVARAALESALAALAAQREGMTLAAWIRRRAGLPGSPASDVRVQALVAGATPDEVTASARRALGQGFTVFKLKLGADRDVDADRDLARVAALRAAIGPGGRIRLDANEAWTRAEAERVLARLAPFAIEFVEQPVVRTDLDGLAALDRAGPIAVAADEALIGDGLAACLARRAARIIVVKPAVLGGIGPAIALAARARAAGVRIVYSNLIEGRVGRETATAIAAALALPNADGTAEVHGLGTAALLARDLEPAGEGWAAPTSEGERLELDAGWLARFACAHRDGAARDAAALVCEDHAYPYTALMAAVRAADGALGAAGFEAGDLVAVLAPPSPAGVVLIHAMLERRVVLLPLNLRLTEVELARALATTRPTALVVTEALDRDLAARLARAGGCRLFALGSGAGDAALQVVLAPRSPGQSSESTPTPTPTHPSPRWARLDDRARHSRRSGRLSSC
ncbi:MAG: o-succinylbenzoate synthase [Deltaproteobacteria bacterium]|nr:o-succinylbenzoate synthase [Deltaproteobacteria bacterium]